MILRYICIIILSLHIFPNDGILLRDPVTFTSQKHDNIQSDSYAEASPYKWKEEYYENMPVDHFSYVDDRTFKLRYFINVDHFKTNNAPIFFYTGNEGSLESFAVNTGFMWDIAPEFGAAVVFAEHRFYGKTKPFGNESYSSVKNMGYLSSEQALADFAQLITYLKQEKIPNAKSSPVIAFGGSYGGMLTAWMRIKYPHIIDGGIAASAPVFWFRGTSVPDNTYDKIVTRTFQLSGCNPKNLIASFKSIRNLAKTNEGREYLNEVFHLSNDSLVKTPEDGAALVLGIQGVMESLAMVDYPYPANFLSPLPAWPVKESCKTFGGKPKKSDKDNALAAYNILNVYFNTSGTVEKICVIGNCPGPFSALGDPDGWVWQTCTEMQMPQCSAGPPDDVFDRNCPYTVEGYLQTCRAQFGNRNFTAGLYRPDWAITNYGARFPTATNIVFSNGYLDPWSGGGWSLKPITKGSLVSLIIDEGAHHLDLRGANDADPESVKEVRRIEKNHIARWIVEAKSRGANLPRKSNHSTKKHN